MRVVQWATGAMGRTCLQAVLDSPRHELVGLFVYGERKAGMDAGEIARRDPVGVTATRDIEDILALDADVVVHAARLDPPAERHDEDIMRLLRSGKNVISINGGTYPAHWPDDRRARLQAAAEAGGVSFMGAGLNPGFAAEKLAVLATGVCRQVESVSLSEIVDCRLVKSPEYVFDVIGFGAPVDRIDPNAPDWAPARTMNALFEEVVDCVANRLGWRAVDFRTDHSLTPAREPLDIAAGRIEPGGAARIDWRWIARADGKDRVNLHIAWTMEAPELDAPEPGLWSIHVEGEPCVSITFGVDTPAGWKDRVSAEMLGVAGAVLNAMPHAIAAPPGVIETPCFAPWSARGSNE